MCYFGTRRVSPINEAFFRLNPGYKSWHTGVVLRPRVGPGFKSININKVRNVIHGRCLNEGGTDLMTNDVNVSTSNDVIEMSVKNVV